MLAKTANPCEKIVLVDDEEDVLEFMSYQLKKLNYDVYTQSNGMEALLLIEEIHPQLIISDMRMPLMSGIELCKEIKKNEELKTCHFGNANPSEIVLFQLQKKFSNGGENYLPLITNSSKSQTADREIIASGHSPERETTLAGAHR